MTNLLKYSALIIAMLGAGIIGLAWTFGGEDDSLAWTALSKPLGIGLLYVACRIFGNFQEQTAKWHKQLKTTKNEYF